MYIDREINVVGQEKSVIKFLLIPRITRYNIAWLCRVRLRYVYSCKKYGKGWVLKDIFLQGGD